MTHRSSRVTAGEPRGETERVDLIDARRGTTIIIMSAFKKAFLSVSLSHFDMPAALGGAFGDLTGKESQGMHNPRAFARLFKGHVAKLTRLVFF